MNVLYAPDLLGALLMVTLLFTGGWRAHTSRHETRALLVLILTVLTGCIVDLFCWMIDGTPGGTWHVISYAVNSILYLLAIILGPTFLTMTTLHIRQDLPVWHWKLIWAVCLTELMLLVINLFVPIVFLISEDNVYIRGELFWLYMLVEVALILYGIAIYVVSLARGRLMPFFQVWLFFLPLVVTLPLQSFFYSVSLIWPSLGIATGAIIICLQNESIYLDKLTGLYNRYYLDELTKRYKMRRHRRFAALMLDLNDFKAINDQYSHTEGDAALIAFARILTDTVHSEGVVIRFAGDEFIILLESAEDGAVERCRSALQKALDAYNEASGKPYRLSAAIGGDLFDVRIENASEFMNRIDQKMYEDKKGYYREHDRRSRR